MVIVEALDFGLHVLEAGLFGGEGGFVWFRFWFGDVGFVWGGRFCLLGGWFGFAWVIFLREAQGL